MHALAVDFQPHGELLRVGYFVAGDQPGADRAESVATLALVPGAAALDLELAFADVIDGAVTGDKVQRVFLRHIACARADDHAQLDFPIGLD